MARLYRSYSDADVIKYAAEVVNLRQLLLRCGLVGIGGNYANMKRILQRLGVDCSHWTGQGWSKDKQLKDWSDYTRVKRLKGHLIALRGHSCERCKNTEWQGYPIPLELEHIDGDRTNNDIVNLLLLCCNCHALTATWRGRKNSKKSATILVEQCPSQVDGIGLENRQR